MRGPCPAPNPRLRFDSGPPPDSRGGVLFGPWSGLCLAAINAWRMGRRARARWYAILDVAGTGLVLVLIGVVAFEWFSAQPMTTGRVEHSATVLTGGLVLVAGGIAADTGEPTASTEIYDPERDACRPGPPMHAARHRHRATLLLDGTVLVSGGADAGNDSLDSAELYDPRANTWQTAGRMHTARAVHTATLLPTGQVLVAGGATTAGPGVLLRSLDAVERFDPDTGAWSSAPPFTVSRLDHTATRLPDGRVLVVGGGVTSQAMRSAELYDPARNAWEGAGELADGRLGHAATLLADGTVLIAGGNSTAFFAEVYDSTSGTWSRVGELAHRRYYQTATLLTDGRVLVVGGAATPALLQVLSSAEVFDPTTRGWFTASDLSAATMRAQVPRPPASRSMPAPAPGKPTRLPHLNARPS